MVTDTGATDLGPSVWRRNRLLAAMPEAEQHRLAPDLELVDLGARAALYAVDQAITHVYFPLDCVISVVAALDDGTVVEAVTTGAEGVVGLPAFLGVPTSPHETYCQVPGRALRLEVGALHRFFTDDGALHDLMHRYTQSVLVFLAQNVACNRMHRTEERCARWLAQTYDRVDRDTFALRQDFLAQMLGVRRATVSTCARALQRAGLIGYSRGQITVRDPDGLRAAACGCYATVRRAFDHLPR